MKTIAFLDENGGLAAGGLGASPDAIVASPLDAHAYVVTVPPLKGDQIDGAVRYRLRALHPGNPDTARVDSFPNGRKRTSVIAFVSDPSIADRYRAAGARTYPPLHFMRSLAPPLKGRWIAVFCAPSWTDAALFDGDEVIATEAIAEGLADADRIPAFVASLAAGEPLGDLSVRVFRIPDRAPLLDPIVRAISAAGVRCVEIVDVTDIGARALKNDGALFLDLPKRNRNLGRVIASLIVLDLVLATIAVHRVAASRERDLAALKSAYASTKRKLAETESAVRELEALEKKRDDFIRSRPVDAYATVAEIARCVGPGAWIKDLAIRGDSFALEAEGADSLAVLAAFTASPMFAAVNLRQATPSAERGEVFSISGTIKHDR